MNIVIFGEKGSGKSCLITRLIHGTFSLDYFPTQETTVTNADIDCEYTRKNFTFREVPEQNSLFVRNMDADFYILMIDGSKPRPESNISVYLDMLSEEQKIKTIIIVGKYDLPRGFKLDNQDIAIRVSSRSCYNIPEVTTILEELDEELIIYQ